MNNQRKHLSHNNRPVVAPAPGRILVGKTKKARNALKAEYRDYETVGGYYVFGTTWAEQRRLKNGKTTREKLLRELGIF